MPETEMRFAVDSKKIDRINSIYSSLKNTNTFDDDELKAEERLFSSLQATNLLNTTVFQSGKKLITVGEQFEEAYFVVKGEVLITVIGNSYRLGAGSVLGLSEGIVGLASKYTATTATSLQVKIIPFHKVDSIINTLPSELKAIMVTIIKRNLTTNTQAY